MKLRKYAVICYILAVAMILPLSSMAATQLSANFVAPDYAEPYIDGLGSASALSISLDHAVGEVLNIKVTDSRTGKVWETNPVFNSPDKAGTTEAKSSELHSQIVMTYTFDKNGSADKLADIGYVASASTEATFNSHQESVVKNQLTIYNILDNGELLDYYVDVDADTLELTEIPAGRTVVGYKIIYGFGDRNAPLYPMMITETRMQQFVDQIQVFAEDGTLDEAATEKMKETLLKKYRHVNLDDMKEDIEKKVKRKKTDAEKEALRKQLEEELQKYIAEYPIILTEGIYELYSDAISTTRNKKLLISYWEAAGYTRNDLNMDHELVGYVSTSGGVAFDIPVEYVIEGNTFRASVITDEIVYPSEVGITRLNFLPGFGGADDTVIDGYSLVPDGCGTLIPVNAEDQRQTGYQVPVMARHRDEALSQNGRDYSDIPYYETTMLPVFGQKQDDNAYFCIIEEGYEFANVVAYVADRFTKYNTAFAAFFPTVTDDIYYASGSTSGIKMFPKIEIEMEETVTERTVNEETGEVTIEEIVKTRINNFCRLPATNLSVRYSFLEGEKANYAGMAEYYRTYLMNTYGMSKLEATDSTAFYTDIYGIMDKKVSYVGFPINTKYALTTFEEAETIVNDLIGLGVEDLTVRYVGMINGGLNQRYAGNFKVESNLGGKSGYKEFLTDMSALGVNVYPDIDVIHVYQDRIFDGFSPDGDAVVTLGKTESVIYDTNIATGRKDNLEDSSYYHPRWVVSPKVYDELFDEIEGNLEDYGNMNLSLGTLGYRLSSDFDFDMIIDRGQAARVIAEEMKELRDAGYDLLVERGFAYTLPYVSTVLNIPMTSSDFTVAEYDVPFMQMVIHGLIEFAGEPFNVTQDVQYNILKCLEYGAGVYARFMYEDDSVFQNTYFLNLFSMNYKNWMDEAKTIYSEVNAAIGDVQNQFIVNHECLAENVYRTTYEGGKQVIVNYNTVDYVVEELGVTVGARDYVVMGGAQ